MRTIIWILAVLLCVYGILWIFSYKRHVVEYGISFNQNHAESLGLDWKEVYSAILSELSPPYVRVAAMWSEIEKESGVYDFADVDYLMDEAQAHDARVLLVVGQKAPRWPECHVPEWVKGYSNLDAKDHLEDYVRMVVDRYKSHEALEYWQVENEPFIPFEFGDCSGYQQDAIYDEIDIVRELDPDHKILVTDSGELSTWRLASKAGDLFGHTLYRIVHTPGGRIFSYDWLPPATYRLKGLIWGRGADDTFVSELQAEPWFTDSDPTNTSLDEQKKTMNVDRLKKHFDYVERIGFSRAYLWGAEWWYFMKEKHGESDFWETVRLKIQHPQL